MKNHKQLQEFIKKVIRECLEEAGPSAQAVRGSLGPALGPPLGPSLKDDEGVPTRAVCDADDCDSSDKKTPPDSFNRP